MTKTEALKQYFGHSGFRPAQETLIDALLSGRDVLGVMPTGAGKSICYQIPALLMAGTALVVSPLISLMKDQVAQLKQSGIPGAYINSSLTSAQYREVIRRASEGRYKIIYVAPERLETDEFLRYATGTRISLVAVDEAHCVSQWGQDFRPSYLGVPRFINMLATRPVVGAFTATATAEVKHDMERLLELRSPLSLTTGFDRPNLYFQVAKPKYKPAYFREIISRRVGSFSATKSSFGKAQGSYGAGGNYYSSGGISTKSSYGAAQNSYGAGGCGIVYCATRKAVDTIYSELKNQGLAVARYHAGMDDDDRRKSQDDFIGDRVAVMIATNAFGMGIDKPNVRYVIHYNMPKNLESYYQEAGRAGRDGNRSECILMFSQDDIKIAEFFINNSEKNVELTEQERRILFQRDYERLDKMIGYCETTGCLRVYLLRYFGDKYKGNCGNCGSCSAAKRQRGGMRRY